MRRLVAYGRWACWTSESFLIAERFAVGKSPLVCVQWLGSSRALFLTLRRTDLTLSMSKIWCRTGDPGVFHVDPVDPKDLLSGSGSWCVWWLSLTPLARTRQRQQWVSSMLQRHFENTDAAHHFENAGRNFGGLNQSFEKELKELYLQQVELERSFSHQDPTATGQTGTEPPDSISDSVKAAGEGIADAIGNLTNLTEETKAEVEYFLANHTPGKMLVYWFGPFAGWACADSAFSTQQVCGYFGGWLNYETFVLLLFIPVAVLVIYIYFILDFVLIDTTDPAFDDEEFRRQHGWSLAQHQWELKYILGSFALPLELVILWQLGLLQILLQALAPYLVAALIICTGLAPIIVTTYIQVSRRLHSLCQRFSAVEHMLESLTKHIMGDIEAIKDTLRAGFSTPRLANDSASSAPHEPKGEAKVPRPGCCWMKRIVECAPIEKDSELSHQLDDGWPESVQEHSERYKYEDLIAWNNIMKHNYRNIRWCLKWRDMVQTCCEKEAHMKKMKEK